MSSPLLLDVQDLSITFRTDVGLLYAVRDLSFSLQHGQTLGIVGESGCGKSVTALSVLRLLGNSTLVKGTVNFEGRDLMKLSLEEMRRVRGKEISMIFQEPMTALNPVHTVGEQIAEVLRVHESHLSRPAIHEKVLEMLALVGISEPQDRFYAFPHQLSGGMRQRVMIAMALICRPKLLIADEPTTALDVTIQAQILRLIRDLKKNFKMAMLLITHDLGVVSENADDIIVMYAGRVVEEGTLSQIFDNPLHPYTQGLLHSIPKDFCGGGEIPDKSFRLQGIPGAVPDPRELLPGCPFYERCGIRQLHCMEKDPVLERKRTHKVRCFEV